MNIIDKPSQKPAELLFSVTHKPFGLNFMEVAPVSHAGIGTAYGTATQARGGSDNDISAD